MSRAVKVLKLTLHNRLVGYLLGFSDGRNILSFSDEYRIDESRPTLSLTTHRNFPKAQDVMSEPWVRKQRLHPVLSNLLPEGVLRELIAQGLKMHIDNEFEIFSYLGQDLPGALVATPMEPDDVPINIQALSGKAKAIKFGAVDMQNKFSLAGVQMKFSMKEKDGRYNFALNNELGDWIVKTPSTKYKDVPLNEYTAMKLAEIAGVDIPEIQLIELERLENLPQINLPDEKLAYAIKRFDRDGNKRIHMEDFAQVFVKYPQEKYQAANYEQIAQVIYNYCGEGITDIQQFARRLLVNILLANGDAHLKNWSLYYPDMLTPRLSPAYDMVTTNVYIDNETRSALNLGKTKQWYNMTLDHFQYWSQKSAVPWRIIKPHLDDVMDKTRTLWPDALTNLPMNEEHKVKLKAHWLRLSADFRLEN